MYTDSHIPNPLHLMNSPFYELIRVCSITNFYHRTDGFSTGDYSYTFTITDASVL
jgi:hypothetical protein